MGTDHGPDRSGKRDGQFPEVPANPVPGKTTDRAFATTIGGPVEPTIGAPKNVDCNGPVNVNPTPNPGGRKVEVLGRPQL